MPVSYRRLWRILETKGLSKTDLRNSAGISTATLAKLSAGDIVALPILEKVCQTLGCRIEDVLEFIPAASHTRWKRVRGGENYVVRLLYLVRRGSAGRDTAAESDRAQFLYGFSIACGEEAEPRRVWETEKINGGGPFEVWAVSLILSGESLSALLVMMEQEKSLQSLADQCGARLKEPSKKSDSGVVPAISGAVFYPGGAHYRPEIVLIPKTESYRLAESCQPIHSPDDEPLFCEAFVSAGMQDLYCGEDGRPEPERMDVIREAFRREGLLLNGNRDLVRIGAFEVLSHMKEGALQRELYSVEPIVEGQDPYRKYVAGYRITVHPQHLEGDYRLEATVYNAGNPTAWKVFDLTMDGKDVVRQIDLEESSGSVEVRLFEVGTGERIELIGFQSLTLVREMSLIVSVAERRGRLIDRYTKREKRADDKIERYASENLHIGDKGNDPWRKWHERVYDDFEQLYGAEQAETGVFSHEGASHEDFLRWLRKKTNANGIGQVYLFDPYIDADSICRIIRLIGSTDVRYTIVTDMHPKGRADNRIEKIKTACRGLDVLLPPGTRVLAFDLPEKESVLHDRFLFLAGGQYLPEVYNMSNSLDNIGAKTPSVVCKLARGAAYKIANHYMGLLAEKENEGAVRVLWEFAQSARSAAPRASEEGAAEALRAAVLPFNQILEQNGKDLLAVSDSALLLWPDGSSEQARAETVKLLCAAAGSHWSEFTRLFYNAGKGRRLLSEGLSAAYDDRLAEKLSSVLKGFLDEIKDDAELVENRGMVVSTAPDAREILRSASWLMDNPWERRHSRNVRIDVRLAAETLIRHGFPVFRDIFADLCEIRSKASVEAMFAFLELLSAEMDASSAEQQETLAEACLRSAEPHLTAMGIQWFVRQYHTRPETLECAARILEGTDSCQELFREIVIEHQIILLRKRGPSSRTGDEPGDDLKLLKETWARWLPEGLDKAQLGRWFDDLSFRDVGDTCDMASLARERRKTSAEEARDYLIASMFSKLDAHIKLEDGHFGVREIQDGERFLDTLIAWDDPPGIRDFLKKLAASEKKLVRSLHDVFLHAKNYSKWKCYIDMLVWCRLMRELCGRKVENYEELLSGDTNFPVRSREIDGLFGKYDPILSEHSELYQIWRRLS